MTSEELKKQIAEATKKPVEFIRESKIATVFYHGSVYEIWGLNVSPQEHMEILGTINHRLSEGNFVILTNTYRVVCIGPKSGE